MMVVVVLTISCQVSEKCRKGPEAAHRTMRAQQVSQVTGLPARSEARSAQ